MKHLTLMFVLAGGLVGLSGCINWQAAYDDAARRECMGNIDSGDRSACLDRVQTNSSDKRAGRRE